MSIFSRAMRPFDRKRRPDYEAAAVLPDRTQLAAEVELRTPEFIAVVADTLRLVYEDLKSREAVQIASSSDLRLWFAQDVIDDCQRLSKTFEIAEAVAA